MMDKGSAKEKDEPKLVPGWLKSTSNGIVTGVTNAIYKTSAAAQLDENVRRISMRVRTSQSSFDQDDLRSSSRSLSSYHRTSSTNGSMVRHRDNSEHSKLFSNSGRGHHSRDRDKVLDSHDKDSTFFLDNFVLKGVSRDGKDNPRRSETAISIKRNEPLPKRSGNGFVNGVVCSMAEFDSEFPSLGTEEKKKPCEIARISSPGFSSAVQSTSVRTSAGIAEGWSVLAGVPSGLCGGGPLSSSSSLTTVSLTSTPRSPNSTPSGLNMAKAVAQAPSHDLILPQVSVESQRIEELTRRQIVKLIPVMPSFPKNSANNPTEKSKLKVVRVDPVSTPRGSQQTPLNVAIQPSRTAVVSDAPKAPSSGNFQVLNRQRNGFSSTVKDAHNASNSAPSATEISAKSSANSHSQGQAPHAEKKASSNAKNRKDFFNSLRKKTSFNHSTSTPPQLVSTTIFSENSCETKSMVCVSYPDKDGSLSSRAPENSAEKSGCAGGGCGSSEELESFSCNNKMMVSSSDSDIVDPEEKAFLESLGWNENGEAAALTASEVAEFMEENRERMPSSKLDHLERIACTAFGLNSLGIGREA